MVAGHWWGGGVGIAGEKAWHGGGPRGMAGAVADWRWGVFSGLAAQGVEVEDEPQALDFVSNGCKID